MENEDQKKFLSDEVLEKLRDKKMVIGIDPAKEGEDISIDQVGVFHPTVNGLIYETAIAIEERLAKTLANQIDDKLRPLKQSRIEYLEQELQVSNFLMMEIQETYLGMYLLRRIHKKIKKDAEKKEVDKKKVLNKHVEDVSKIVNEYQSILP